MESVNDIHRERVNFLTVTLFRLSGAPSTRAPRRSRLASARMKRGLASSLSSVKRALPSSLSSVKRALAIAVVGAVAVATLLALLHSPPASAELENSIYTSKIDRLRLVVPRGWRATDQPSYPGLLLWMVRADPDSLHMVLTAQAFTR